MTFEEAMQELNRIVPTGYLVLEVEQWHHSGSQGGARARPVEPISCRVSLETDPAGKPTSVRAQTLAGVVAKVRALYELDRADKTEAASVPHISIPSIEGAEPEMANMVAK